MKNRNIEIIFSDCLKLVDSKNDDYANPQDFYANFRTVEACGIPVWVGVYIRLLDKITRLSGFIRRFNATGVISAKHECIEDTLMDGINYLAICLDTYRQWKNNDEVIAVRTGLRTDKNESS